MRTQCFQLARFHSGGISCYTAVTSRIRPGPTRLKVVVDCGNGTAGYIAPKLLRELGSEVVELYCKYDSSLPNHHPDSVKVENCQDLIGMVRAEKGRQWGIWRGLKLSCSGF